MGDIKITATYTPEDEETDDLDPSGLTEEAFTHITGALMDMGFSDIEIKRV